MSDQPKPVIQQLGVTSRAPAETSALGMRLGNVLTPGLVVALSGDLGAGKTALTQGIAAGLGLRNQITSPTFTLVNHYAISAHLTLSHIDCYRLPDDPSAAIDEAATFGLDEILADPGAIVVIEWAERVAPMLPADRLAITLVQVDAEVQTRQITLRALGPQSVRVLEQLFDVG